MFVNPKVLPIVFILIPTLIIDEKMAVQEIIRVRDAEPDDLRDIHQIAQHSFKDPYPLRLLRHIHSTEPEGFLAAELNGEVVGYVIGIVRWGNVGHILAIAVDKEYREEGVGSALLINALDRLKNNGADRVRLEVRISNESAKNFYDKIGFEALKTVPSYYSDGEAAISMEYRFDES